MTIKQIFLCAFTIGMAFQANAMQRKQRNNPTRQHKTQQIIFINNGNFTNYGTAEFKGQVQNQRGAVIQNFGSLNVEPSYSQPRYTQPTYSHYNYHTIQNIYVTPQNMSQQQFHPHAFTVQKHIAANREKQEAQEKSYNELKELHEVQDLLPQQQAQQINNVMKLSGKEGRAIAEIVMPQLNTVPEIKDIKPFIELLTKADKEKLTLKPQPIIPNDPLSFHDPRFLVSQKKETPLWYTIKDELENALSPETKHICAQLELLVEKQKQQNPENLDTWNKIMSSRTS